jgi:peroxiredoxin
MSAMGKLHRKLKHKNFAMVSVSLQDSAGEVRRFFKQNQLTFTVLLDSFGKTVPDLAIRAIPTTLILDKNGRIVGRVTGQRQWDSRESIALFDQLIDEPIAGSTESHSL